MTSHSIQSIGFNSSLSNVFISSQVIFTIIFSVAHSLSSFSSVTSVNQFIEIKNHILEKLL